MSPRLIVLVSLIAVGCGPPAAVPPPVVVQVEYPASYGARAAAGAKVTVKGEAGEHTVEADAEGRATFEGLAPGTYAIAATRALSADEAFSLTGHLQAVDLTATLAERELPADGVLTVTLGGPRLGSLVIKELYYTGARGIGADDHYFHDQFIELFNNSTETLYADGLFIADVYGISGEINPGEPPTPFQSDAEHVYVSSVWRIPGSGTDHPLKPGESLVIAQDGANHQPDSALDLSDADFETYTGNPEDDVDRPTVPNLTAIQFNGGIDWLLTVFGPGVVVFQVPDITALERVSDPDWPSDKLFRVPVSAVVDGVEALMDAQSGGYKRLPASVDKGFVFASGTYVGESARRKVVATIGERRVLRDTNDCEADFEVISAPTPRGFGE